MSSPDLPFRLFFAVAIAGFTASLPMQAATLYTEDFNASGSTLTGESWSGWGALGDATVATTFTTTTGASPDARLQRTAGSGSSKALFAQARNSGSPTVIHDRFVAITTAIGGPHSLGNDEALSLGTIQWDQALTAITTQSVQLLVQVGGTWHASLQSFTNTGANSSAGAMTNPETKTFDFAGASGLGTTAWYNIAFGDGSPITLQAQVESPIGTTLTGVGFAMFTGNASTRTIWIDNVQIISVPEPTSFALLGLGMIGFAARRRR